MARRVRRVRKRDLTLIVSGGLVLLMGGLGLAAGHMAGQQAREVHREDRSALQQTLAGLVDQYTLLTAGEVADALAATGPWSGVEDDSATLQRLEGLVDTTRTLDAGAILVSASGKRLAAWSADGLLPAPDDPGWAALRASVLSGKGTLPLSGVLLAGEQPRLALALPVTIDDGSRALVVGLWDPRRSPLQQYVAELVYGQTGHGYVVDRSGRVIAGPTPAVVGDLLPMEELRTRLEPGGEGILDTDDAGVELVSSYAAAGSTGWTALTPQSREEFEGALVRSSRLVELAVVALLLIAGTGLVVLHRKRETALKAVALRDELTGLYNRRGWFVLAEHELERARRQGSSRVLLFIDVDGLKQVNDVLGHREGDRAIADAAAVLRSVARSSDIVGRLGGDEFVLLLADGARGDAPRRRLVDALAVHNARSGAGFELRLSIGAEVWFPEDACSLDDLLRKADVEMYADKSSRPDRHAGLLRLPAQRDAAELEVPTS